MGWNTVRDVEISDVYQKLPIQWHQYRLELSWKAEDRVVNENYCVTIQDSQIGKALERLISGKTERECFAFGMQDIDIYKVKDQEDVYCISHSPMPTHHVQFVLKEGELQKLLLLVK